MLFTTFTVKDNEYKLRLNARNIVNLEKQIGCNPISIFGTGDTIPSITTMVHILHNSLQQYQANITLEKTYSIFDELEDITVAGYKLVLEKAITSPEICPVVRDETCIILVPNVLFISILPSRINPTEVQISPSKAIISFFE